MYPDPLSEVTHIDGAAFLYFPKVAAPLPVQPVSDYSEWGADLFDIVSDRQLSWAGAFFALWETWQAEIRGVNRNAAPRTFGRWRRRRGSATAVQIVCSSRRGRGRSGIWGRRVAALRWSCWRPAARDVTVTVPVMNGGR